MKIENNIIGITNQNQRGIAYDPKEAEVAAKLGMTYEEFAALSEDQKKLKVKEYNEAHPENPIEDKNSNPPQQRGSVIDNFFKDVNWDNIKLQ